MYVYIYIYIHIFKQKNISNYIYISCKVSHNNETLFRNSNVLTLTNHQLTAKIRTFTKVNFTRITAR